MNTNFDRIFSLAKKSNSRLVVFDKTEGDHFVVLGIDDFEGLLGNPSTNNKPEPKPQLPATPAEVKAEPKTESEHFIDSTRAEDEALLQKLNEQIAEWRRDELAKAAAAIEAPQEPVVELELPPEPVKKPVQPITIPVTVEPEPEEKWHKLGDVLAGSSLGKVSYEPLGEQGIKPLIQEETVEYAEPEPLNDDPVFLEEPLG